MFFALPTETMAETAEPIRTGPIFEWSRIADRHHKIALYTNNILIFISIPGIPVSVCLSF